ncbi:substrate-binding domain-containing protein [Nonomuraea sp. NPDC049709]|uniref:substrate-binding domain-containing protein n=1 Tax=Nonomuraea sp. NPDC049709 TaxID=3154736 RepID=UPI0034405819
MDKNVARRGFLFGGAALGAGALVSACTSNEPAATPQAAQASGPAAAPSANSGNDTPGEKVVIGFSAPAADHGWIAAISKNAAEAVKQYSDVEFKPVEPTNDINQQISAVESLIQAKVNVLVILPNDGQRLRPPSQAWRSMVAQRRARIPAGAGHRAGHPYAGAWWPPRHGPGYENAFVHEMKDFLETIAAAPIPLRPSRAVCGCRRPSSRARLRAAASRLWRIHDKTGHVVHRAVGGPSVRGGLPAGF